MSRRADSARPGDYLLPQDDEIAGFKARLNERLAPVGSQFSGDAVNNEWQVGDTTSTMVATKFRDFHVPFSSSTRDTAQRM